ncbi:hypothetical protein AAFF_G00034570 [Aldrovandia affinis]|uniref:Homeobox domain-containing protein n=1 Tax=Aldrovandia affinis TaxID=143900 RepID=A0AAD7S3K0_9TELE|nr:hypothetical protein AAFF_G00034570 [Aldrovandia affinis]
MAANSLTTCCESSGRTLAETGVAACSQTPVYCPVYESRLLATARHELNPAATMGVYGNPYTSSQCYGNYVTYGTDTSAFYSLSTFDSKDGTASAHAGITQAAAYYPYDASLGQYQYDRYGSIDGGTRRKNATRETTSTLKAWLQEHKKNPYPTKGEKIMLAIITKMTLTQVSTWFANARRRLKKENKMTWPPRTKSSDEKGYDDDADEEEASQEQHIKSEQEDHEDRTTKDKDLQLSDLEDIGSIESESSECELKPPCHMNTHMWTTTDCRNDHPKETTLNISVPVSLGVVMDRQQDSPVATLRNWVDGVFHDPLFRHNTLNQALANTTVSWAATKGAILETSTLGRSVGNNEIKEHITSLQHKDSTKDRMEFPKTGNKIFCS